MDRRKKENKYYDQYLPVDKYFCVNENDDETTPVYISLPKPPPIELIDGYGLPALEQKFKRLEIPKRLKLLEDRVFKELTAWSGENKHNTITGYKILEKYWDILTEEQDYYIDEIKFIKNFIWYTIHGYWCFIKGKPTYLPPWYFSFLNTWKMPDIKIKADKYPQYRDEDRKTELYKYYLFKTRETFKNLDEKGRAVKVDGKYEMIELSERTFCGVMRGKRRQCGESNRAINNLISIAKSKNGMSCVIVADSGEHARAHWVKRLIPAWQSWPMFVKPIWDGNNAPIRLNFSTPANVYNKKQLGGSIRYIDSAKERVVDSETLDGVLLDESAKLDSVDSNERWNITKYTLIKGTFIGGWAELPSTVEEMNEGGEEFYDMWVNSDFYVRNKVTGQTTTSLARQFISAELAYEGFIDPWGFSVTDTPNQDQIQYAEKDMTYASLGIGSKEYHYIRRKKLLDSGSPRDMKEYRGLIRRDPINSSEMWKGTGGDVGFPIEAMSSRLSELRINNYQDVVTGNFVSSTGDENGIIDFREDINGKWNVSLILDRENIYGSNEQKRDWGWSNRINGWDQVYAPVYKSRFTMGVDPITNLSRIDGVAAQTRLSNAGISVYWEVDKSLEPYWNSDTGRSGCFVATYSYRPDTYQELVMDVIFAAKYYGAMIYFERNKEELMNRIDDLGYSGYFKYKFNPKTHQFEATPGGYAGGDSMDNLLNSLRDYFELRSHVEKHHRILEEGISLTGKERLTRKDLLTASGWALEGSKSTYGKLLDEHRGRMEENKLNFSGTFLGRKSYR